MTAPARPVEPRFSSPETYIPKHLAEKILTSKAALEGERKQVTVLFADLKGSMELLADRDPEEAREILDPVLERMMEAVHRYEGTVNQVMGDGIMALFGAPLAQEDHAIRACYAALRLQETIRLYAEEVRRAQGIAIQIRIGLNSGEVVVRSIGSDLRMDYSAVGQTTHLAARMEQMATPGTILLTHETLALAEGFVQVAPLGPMGVKGLPSPIEVFELTGASHVRSRLQAAAARGLTRFVGRDAEIELLSQALERARGGRGQVVAVVGEPGVGKSRLAWEFTHSHRTRDWLVLEAASVSYSKTTTYFPVIELLKSYFQVEPRDEARKIHEKVTGKLLSLDRALEPTLPVFLSLLDIPVDDPRWARLDPPQRRRQTLDALKRLLFRESQVQPLLLVFEDLHWIDSETQALLDTLVDSVPTARVFLLISYRPEYAHAWGSKTYYQQLRLDVLPAATADELLDSLVGRDAGLGALKSLLIERTEGNAFFLEEAVRALSETKILVGERGAYRLTGPIHTLLIPAKAQAVLAARIDRLAPEDKRLLHAAAVVGKDVPFALMQAIADEPEEHLRAGLTRLQAAEFLYESQLFPDLEYTFKHALTHEVAYENLLQDRRRQLDVKLVAAIETLYPNNPLEEIERLARHALRGEIWDKAVTYCRGAGYRASIRSAHRAAVGHFEDALMALKHLPDDRAKTERAIDIHLDLRSALTPLGDFAKVLEHLQDADALALSSDDLGRQGLVASFLTNYFTVILDLPRAIECGQRALAIADRVRDLRLQVMANAYLSTACYGFGEFDKACALGRRSTALLTGEDVGERFGMAQVPAAYSRTVLAWSLAEVGEFDEGLSIGEEAVRIGEVVGHAHSLIFACLGLGTVYHRKGDFEEAVPILQRAFSLCQSADVPVAMASVASPLASSLARSGRSNDAIKLLELSISSAVSIRDPVGYWLRTGGLAESYLTSGRMVDALNCARRAVEIVRFAKTRGTEVHALLLLAEILANQDPEAATAPLSEAFTLATNLGMRPAIARCHLGFGTVHSKLGHFTEAKAELGVAVQLFREMAMERYRLQADSLLGASFS